MTPAWWVRRVAWSLPAEPLCLHATAGSVLGALLSTLGRCWLWVAVSGSRQSAPYSRVIGAETQSQAAVAGLGAPLDGCAVSALSASGGLEPQGAQPSRVE